MLNNNTKKISEITAWVDNAFIANDTINKANDLEVDNKLTFLTNFGFVVGKKAKLANLDFSNDDSFISTFSQLKEQGVPIDKNSFTNALYKSFKEKAKNQYVFEDEGEIIYLDDVEIYFYNNFNNPIKVTNLTLFSNQITGVIPGEIELKPDTQALLNQAVPPFAFMLNEKD